jgi:aspartyl-tRNA(Asn)/glutamyl-tRNA(Gln) amidotransferase subunit C
MTKLSREDVLKLARLSRLRLTDDEVDKFMTELSAILDYVAHLETADVTGLEPTYQVTGLTNVTRPDVIKDYGGVTQKDLLKNVPHMQDDLIKVGRMIV